MIKHVIQTFLIFNPPKIQNKTKLSSKTLRIGCIIAILIKSNHIILICTSFFFKPKHIFLVRSCVFFDDVVNIIYLILCSKVINCPVVGNVVAIGNFHVEYPPLFLV